MLTPEEYETITSTSHHSSCSLVTFRKDGSLRVRHQGKRQDFLRLSGNEFDSDLGVAEAQASEGAHCHKTPFFRAVSDAKDAWQDLWFCVA